MKILNKSLILVLTAALLLSFSCDSQGSSKYQLWSTNYFPGAENLNQAGVSYVYSGAT